MYCCTDCGAEFEYVEIVYETHGLSTPPYERIKRCPACHGTELTYKENTYCKFCGSRLNGKEEYCSEKCKKLGEKYYAEQTKRRNLFKNSSVAVAVREVAEYNKAHSTKYSYGQYFALKASGGLK